MNLYNEVSHALSKKITWKYSTSFSWSIQLFHPSIRQSIYDIYGFVRLADEIVDSFHSIDQEALFSEFEEQVIRDYDRGLSSNPIIQSYIITCREYQIPWEYTEAFLRSMKADLRKKTYNETEYKKYLFGSAEVIGLMCLKVFSSSDDTVFQDLKSYAILLGSAFQKVNFLRDMKSDFVERGRMYFPYVDFENFTDNDKQKIIENIKKEFTTAFKGLKRLPHNARLGVLVAYYYYWNLLRRLEMKDSVQILESRTRVPNWRKVWLILISYARLKLGRL